MGGGGCAFIKGFHDPRDYGTTQDSLLGPRSSKFPNQDYRGYKSSIPYYFTNEYQSYDH
jgi:hypothetical protein